MAVQPLSFTGINRAVSDFVNAGSCEELINLRPTTQGLVPVSPFGVRMSDAPYSRIFVHHSTSGDRIIGIRGTEDNRVVIEWVRDDDTPLVLANIVLVDQSEVESVIGHTSFAEAGNVILFSIYETVFENRAFIWKDGAYHETEADVPAVGLSFSEEPELEITYQDIRRISYSTSTEPECVNSVQDGLSALQEGHPDVCFGTFVAALAFRTADGNTFATGSWRVYDPIPLLDSAEDSPYVDAEIWPAQAYAAFFEKYGHGYQAGGANASYLDHISVAGVKVSAVIGQLESGSWSKETSMITAVELYCSRPKPYVRPEGAYDGFIMAADTVDLILPQTPAGEMNLGGELLYLQKSIPMEDLLDGPQTVELKFGGNLQVTSKTLRVDAGDLTRFGSVVSYNARFHFFDSVSHIDIGMPSFLYQSSGSAVSADVFARYADSDHSELVYLGSTSGYLGPAYMVIAPSLNIKEVLVYAPGNGAGRRVIHTYRMQESSSYNFTICIGGPTASTQITGTAPELETLIRGGVKGITTEEPFAINVTEQYNPFVFNVRNSYLAPGRVLDIQPQMVAVRDVSFGDYPLDVFTDRGTYALLQGDGTVLYSRFRAVSNLVSTSNGIPTESGTFFLAAGGLWLISGSKAVLISDALHLGPHKQIRTCDGFRKVAMGEAAGGYDVSGLLSAVRFKEYTEGATLSYNRYRDELMVSNRAYGYTYVLSLKYRQWFKIDGSYAQDTPGSDIATRPGTVSGKLDVLDLATELDSPEDVDVLVHLQSRPFSFGYRYAHVHRIVSMMRAVLGTEGVIVSLYGSDNLTDWKLLSFSFRAAVSVSQIRTSPASRSWRYYTVCIGGRVPSDTDFGPVLVDYEPVIRRIG